MLRISLQHFAEHDSCGVSASHSQRFHSSFASSDTDRLFHLGHKNFAVADFSGLGLFQNCLDCALRAVIGDHDLELNLWKKIHGVLGAAINLAVSLLAAKSLYLAQSHSFHACRHQGFSHRLGFEWFNDGLDFLHRGKLNLPASEMASIRDLIEIQVTDDDHKERTIKSFVRIFFPIRQVKSESSLAAHAGSSTGDRSRANPVSTFPPQDNATDHWL